MKTLRSVCSRVCPDLPALVVGALPTDAGRSRRNARAAAPRPARPRHGRTFPAPGRSTAASATIPSKASFEPPQGRSTQRPGGFGGGSRRGGRGGSAAVPVRPTVTRRTTGRRTSEARLQALTDQLRKASATLVISHHDPSFVINDAQDHTQFFQTDDSTNDHQVGLATISSTTHWEGPRLVTEYALSSRLKLVFTYTLARGDETDGASSQT